MNKKISTKQGFTIIEVVLVLAIAGLIFLMVFVAFPALQRNQRDGQRRQDYANVQAAVITAVGNNNGTFPKGPTMDKKSANKDGIDPNKGEYTINVVQSNGTVPTSVGDHTVYVIDEATCDGESPTRTGAGSNDFVVYGYLESGVYCRSASKQ